MFEVSIDFDEASRAWMQNKQKGANAYYTYKCQKITQNGTKCSRNAATEDICIDGFFCKQHSNPAPKLTESEKAIPNNNK